MLFMNLEALIREIKNGNAVAKETLFRSLRGRYLNVCKRYTRNVQDAEERMMDGFCRFFVKIETFQYWHDDGLHKWIKTIMINICLGNLDDKPFFSITSENEAHDISEQDTILNKISTDEILKLIQRLPRGYKTVFSLFVIEGYSHIEIGHMLHIQTGSSKSQLAKGKNLLQKMIISNESDYGKQESR